MTSRQKYHCVKYRNFIKFSGVESLWEGTVPAVFLVNRPKLCGNCAFPLNFHTKKLVEITVFYAVEVKSHFQPGLLLKALTIENTQYAMDWTF